MLNRAQQERYSKQLNLPGMGEQAQEKLASAHVLVLGLGGAGATAAQHLAAAGIGKLGLLDNEEVTLCDLTCQTVAKTQDLGRPRTLAVSKHLHDLNPLCQAILHDTAVDAHNIEETIRPYAFVVDGLADWQAKLLVSDTCMRLKIPMIHAGVTGYHLQVFTMVPGKSACLRCVFQHLGIEDLSRRQPNSGLHGPALGIAGSLQATEVIQLVAELGVTGCDELIQFDCLRREFYVVRELGARPDCPDCGKFFQ